MIGVKLNIAKKIAGLKIMILNREKMWHVSDLIELMPNGGGGGATLFIEMFEKADK